MTKDEAYDVAALFDDDEVAVCVYSEPGYDFDDRPTGREYDVRLIPWAHNTPAKLSELTEKVTISGYDVRCGVWGWDPCVFITGNPNGGQ